MGIVKNIGAGCLVRAKVARSLALLVDLVVFASAFVFYLLSVLL